MIRFPVPRARRAPGPLAVLALVAAALLGLAGPAAAFPAPVPPYSVADARAGADFLFRLEAPDGGISSPPASSEADRVGGTVQIVLDGSAVNPRRPEVRRALDFLRPRLDAYVRTGTPPVDNAGRLAYAVLAVRAAGDDPHRFGPAGDLVARLRATQQRTGPDAGLYGTAAAFNGSFTQGLALAALAGVGVHDPFGVGWQLRQACPDGGFTYRRSGPCTGQTASDTNDTAYAVQGLIAQGLPPLPAIGFLARAQNPDGGFPNQPGKPSDGTSTADVLQAIVALHLDPQGPLFTRHGVSAVRALDLYQVRTDDPSTPYDDRGSWSYQRTPTGPGAPDPRFTTTQAVPAAAGRPFPY